MLSVLAYLQAFSWLAFPLFLAVWCALASSGRHDSFSCAPVRVRETSFAVRRYLLR
jgi:hypothetical protein